MIDLYGLIGFPLGHSFSKQFFTEKFSNEGIDAAYDLFPISEIDQLPRIILENPSLRGLNVTIPYKKSVIKFLDSLSEEAVAINAVNTIICRYQNNKIQLIGCNTDAPAFKSELSRLAGNEPSTALVLGTGGAAAAVAYVLEKLNWSFNFVSRSPRNNGHLNYSDLTTDVINNTRLIINTTPLGMYPNLDDAPPIPYPLLTRNHLLFDLVYNPADTMFMTLGKKYNAQVSNGLGMLHKQAELAWQLWQE